jgi:uncharacterized membrane protein
MSRFVVIVFAEEEKAHEGVRALDDLHEDASITLYSKALVQRRLEGSLVVKERETEAAVGVGVDTLVGGLVFMFAGPTDSPVGVVDGTALAALRDLFNLGVTDEFLKTICKELCPGNTALVAEIEEEWVTPLDTRMEGLGGIVMREVRDDFIYEEFHRRIEEREAELAPLRAELVTARSHRTETLKATANSAEEKLIAAVKSIGARASHYRDEMQAKIRALRQQAKSARSDSKTLIYERIAAIRTNETARAVSLMPVSKLTQQARCPYPLARP